MVIFSLLSHQTAISRKVLSSPARRLKDLDLITGRVLDFGCGRGKDAEILKCDGYDPHWAPIDLSDSTYDTVLCTYVFNVVEESEEETLISNLRSLLSPGGKAYISVRRDLKIWKGCQRLVRLALPVLYESSGYCIYILS